MFKNNATLRSSYYVREINIDRKVDFNSNSKKEVEAIRVTSRFNEWNYYIITANGNWFARWNGIIFQWNDTKKFVKVSKVIKMFYLKNDSIIKIIYEAFKYNQETANDIFNEYCNNKDYWLPEARIELKCDYAIISKIENLLSAYKFTEADDLYHENKNNKRIVNQLNYNNQKKLYFEECLDFTLQKYEFKKADYLFNNQLIQCISEEKYIDMKKVFVVKQLQIALEEFNFHDADKLFENHGRECINTDEYNKLRDEYVWKQNNWNKDNIENAIYTALKRWDYKLSDEAYMNNNQYIKKVEYVNIKKSFVISSLETFLERFDFQWADKLYNNHGIQCIAEAEYTKLKTKYTEIQNVQNKKDVIDKIQLTLKWWNYREADDLYESNSQFIWSSEYIKLKKPYIIEQLKNKFEKYLFKLADNLFNNQGIQCINEAEYIILKKPYVVDQLKSILEKFDFQWADILFEDHGISCLHKQEYIEIISPHILTYSSSLLEKYQFFQADNFLNIMYPKYDWLEMKISSEIQVIKEKMVINYISEYKNLYENHPTKEQIKVFADTSKYCLLKARAWSWKTTTLVNKTHFLLQKLWVNKDEIIFLAFNKKAKEDVNTKLLKFGIERFENAMTFHSLSGRILHGNIETETLHEDEEEKDKDYNMKKALPNAIREVLKSKPWYGEQVYEFFRNEIEDFQDKKWLNSQEYYDILRFDETFMTLEWKFVKSKAEKRIADFLFEHDISFTYERTQEFAKENEGKKKYQPDFRLDTFKVLQKDPFQMVWWWVVVDPQKVWIEFHGVKLDDPTKSIPKNWNISYDEYIEKIKWVQQYRRDRPDHTLIEFSVSDIEYWNTHARELFEQKIKQKLESLKIICNKLDQKKLINRVYEKRKTDLEKLIESFITRSKQRKWTPSDIRRKISCEFGETLHAFYLFAVDCYEAYQSELKKHDKRDFNDILQFATELVHKEKWELNINISKKFKIKNSLNKLKYIMVDEFQDFSQLFYELIEAICKYNTQVRLICVWDNRQLINSFAWSEPRFFDNFTNHFPDPCYLDLLTSRRCPVNIINVTNAFMWWINGTKSGKWHSWHIEWKYSDSSYLDEWLSYFSHTHSEIIISTIKQYFTDKGIANIKHQKIFKFLFDVFIKERKNKSDSDFLILSKVNSYSSHDINKYWLHHLVEIILEVYLQIQKSKNKDFNKNERKKKLIWDEKESISPIIRFQTVHKSKGQEADICIVVDIWKKFPMIHPNRVFWQIFWDTKEILLEEEKRVYYVALTRTKNKLYYISEKEIPAWVDHGRFLIDSRGT